MKKKLLVTAMAAMPMLGMFGGDYASATVNSTGTVGTNSTEAVNVYVTQPSTFSVIIPKEITLEQAKTYKEDYTVVVQGNIAGNATVTVRPDVKEFDLVQSGKSNITATVEQNEQTATSSDLENGKTKSLAGTVTAKNVTAGSWKGTFKFNISN